jgi:hypothetical protein
MWKQIPLPKNSTSCSIHIKELCHRIGALVLMVPGKNCEEVPTTGRERKKIKNLTFNFISWDIIQVA